MSRQQMYDLLESNLGYHESPPRSNCNKFSKMLRKPCQAWCGDAQTCAEINGGFNPGKYCDNTSYTPNFYGDLAAHGWATDLAHAQLMDPVFFKFTDRINHVGGFIRMEGDYVITIDGNTGDGGRNEYAGGSVAIKRRHRRLVAGVIHLPVGNAAAQVSAGNVLNDLYNAIKFSKAFVLGQGQQNPEAVVKMAQSGMNRWFDGLAALAHQANPPDIIVNGVWDDYTQQSMNAMKWALKRDDDGGLFGRMCWDTVFPNI